MFPWTEIRRPDGPVDGRARVESDVIVGSRASHRQLCLPACVEPAIELPPVFQANTVKRRTPRPTRAWRAACSSRVITVIAMLSRVTAFCLAVLVLSPFTAPFSTCDLAALFGRAPLQHAPANRPAPTTIAVDGNVANVPAISRVGRLRLLELSTASAAVSPVRRASVHIGMGAAAAVRDRAVFTTILRL